MTIWCNSTRVVNEWLGKEKGKNHMDQIIPAFEISMFDPTLSDVIVEMAEIGIDSCLEDGVLKSIPIVSAIIGVAKTGQHIHDRNLLMQTFDFIKAFNEKRISREKLERYKSKIQSSPKKAEKELGRVLVLLNANADTQKSKILGRLYYNYVDEEIDWASFCELSDATERLFLSDIDLLLSVKNGKIHNTEQCESYRAERLAAVGLVALVQNKVEFSSMTSIGGQISTSRASKVISITGFGDRLLKYGMA